MIYYADLVRNQLNIVAEQYIQSNYLLNEDLVATKFISKLHCYLTDMVDLGCLDDDKELESYFLTGVLDELNLLNSSPGKLRGIVRNELEYECISALPVKAYELTSRILSRFCLVNGVCEKKILALGSDIEDRYRLIINITRRK